MGKYSHARPNHLDCVSAVLDEFPHVYLDTSWDVVAQQFLQKDYVNKDQTVDEAKVTRMKAFVEKYSERLIFGSDTLAPQRASDWSSTIDTFKPLLDVLAPDAKHNLLLKNYEDVIMGARPKVRAYEKHCLPYAYIGIEMRQDRAEEDVKFVRSQVQMGIAYGRSLMEAELSGSSPPTRPPALRSIEDIEKRAYGIVDDSKQKASEAIQTGMNPAPTVLNSSRMRWSFVSSTRNRVESTPGRVVKAESAAIWRSSSFSTSLRTSPRWVIARISSRADTAARVDQESGLVWWWTAC